MPAEPFVLYYCWWQPCLSSSQSLAPFPHPHGSVPRQPLACCSCITRQHAAALPQLPAHAALRRDGAASGGSSACWSALQAVRALFSCQVRPLRHTLVGCTGAARGFAPAAPPLPARLWQPTHVWFHGLDEGLSEQWLGCRGAARGVCPPHACQAAAAHPRARSAPGGTGLACCPPHLRQRGPQVGSFERRSLTVACVTVRAGQSVREKQAGSPQHQAEVSSLHSKLCC